MKEFVVYTALRVALFLGALAIVCGIWFLAADSVPITWAVVISFVISGLGSFVLLDRQRNAFARRVEVRAERVTSKYDDMRTREDVD